MANKLFQTVGIAGGIGTQAGVTQLGAGPALAPAELGGSLDIVRSFRWTLTPYSSPALNEVPYIFLTEYRYLQNQFDTQLTTLGRQATYLAGSDPYKGLYDHVAPSGFTYTIPYFDDTWYDTTNSWASIDAGLISAKDAAGGLKAAVTAGEAAGAIETGGASILAGESLKLGIDMVAGIFDKATMALMTKTNPKVGIIDSPKLWKNANERSYTVQFPLFNTFDQEDIQKNWELCYLLTYQNLFNKKTYFTAIPPVYYEVYIPGSHYSKASFVSHLKIQHKGNIRSVKANWSGKGVRNYNIPDCYIVNITFTDLLMPSQNQMYAMNESTVTTDTGYSKLLSEQTLGGISKSTEEDKNTARAAGWDSERGGPPPINLQGSTP